MEIDVFINSFSELFDDNSIIITSATRFRDLEDWDSMHALSLMAMVDEVFHVKITPTEIKESHTVEDLYGKILLKK